MILYFQKIKFVRVSSLVGRYFYNRYIVNSLKWCFSYMSIINVHVNIILDLPITYRNVSVQLQSECPCLHHTVNFSFRLLLQKIMKIPTQKGKHSCKCTE